MKRSVGCVPQTSSRRLGPAGIGLPTAHARLYGPHYPQVLPGRVLRSYPLRPSSKGIEPGDRSARRMSPSTLTIGYLGVEYRIEAGFAPRSLHVLASHRFPTGIAVFHVKRRDWMQPQNRIAARSRNSWSVIRTMGSSQILSDRQVLNSTKDPGRNQRPDPPTRVPHRSGSAR